MIRVRYHSDCDYFAGCENMLANFFSDPRLARDFDVSFSYRASPAYEAGFQERVPRPPRLIPLSLLDFHHATQFSNSWPAPLRGLYKSLTRLLLIKYWIALWNGVLLYRSLGPEPVDIMHINNGGIPGAVSCLAAGVAARLRGIKTIVHVVNNLPVPYDGPDRWLDWPLDRLAALSASRFVTGSELACRSLIQVLRLEEGRAMSLPNGIAERAVTETPEEVRRRLGVPAGRPLIAVVAVLEERKGHRVLFEALAALKKEGLSPMPVTALGGDGILRNELEQLVPELGLEGDVLFLGWEKRHFNLFNAADIVALPSTGYEDFPNVTIEAMGLGKTVVASRVGGVPEQLEDGESGLLVTPGDVGELARALGRACRDAALRERLGRNAAKRFQERFTAQASVTRYLDLYQTLLPGAAA
jgi:glycosyltransferase involved in cell wall biosynthesis